MVPCCHIMRLSLKVNLLNVKISRRSDNPIIRKELGVYYFRLISWVSDTRIGGNSHNRGKMFTISFLLEYITRFYALDNIYLLFKVVNGRSLQFLSIHTRNHYWERGILSDIRTSDSYILSGVLMF